VDVSTGGGVDVYLCTVWCGVLDGKQQISFFLPKTIRNFGKE
jgi:hypothetical protein